MDKKFLLTTLILGSLIAVTTTGCFHKAEDSSMMSEDEVKMEQPKDEKAQPACEIQEEEEQIEDVSDDKETLE